MLLDKGCIVDVCSILNAGCFYRLDHRVLFEALVDLHTGGDPIDIIVLEDELRRRKQIEQVGGRDYLIELVNSVPSAANAVHYAGVVREKHTDRGVAPHSAVWPLGDYKGLQGDWLSAFRHARILAFPHVEAGAAKSNGGTP